MPRPGPYADRGVMGKDLTVGAYYVYRTSLVFNLRMLLPVGGRGGQIDAVYDVCAAKNCPGPKEAASHSQRRQLAGHGGLHPERGAGSGLGLGLAAVRVPLRLPVLGALREMGPCAP